MDPLIGGRIGLSEQFKKIVGDCPKSKAACGNQDNHKGYGNDQAGLGTAHAAAGQGAHLGEPALPLFC